MHTDGIWCPTTTFKADKCHDFLLYYGLGMHCLLQQHRNELEKQQWKLQSPPAPLLWGLPTSNTSISKTHNVPCPFTTTTHIPESRFVMSLSLCFCLSLLFSSLLLSKVHEETRELVQLLTLGKQRNISDLEVDGPPHPCWWRRTQCAKRRCSYTSHCCKTLFCVPVCAVKVCCSWANGCLLLCVHFFCFLKKFVSNWVQQNATNLVLWKSTTQLKGGGSFCAARSQTLLS